MKFFAPIAVVLAGSAVEALSLQKAETSAVAIATTDVPAHQPVQLKKAHNSHHANTVKYSMKNKQTDIAVWGVVTVANVALNMWQNVLQPRLLFATSPFPYVSIALTLMVQVAYGLSALHSLKVATDGSAASYLRTASPLFRFAQFFMVWRFLFLALAENFSTSPSPAPLVSRGSLLTGEPSAIFITLALVGQLGGLVVAALQVFAGSKYMKHGNKKDILLLSLGAAVSLGAASANAGLDAASTPWWLLTSTASAMRVFAIVAFIEASMMTFGPILVNMFLGHVDLRAFAIPSLVFGIGFAGIAANILYIRGPVGSFVYGLPTSPFLFPGLFGWAVALSIVGFGTAIKYMM